MSYKERIYQNYAKNFGQINAHGGIAAEGRALRANLWKLRGWIRPIPSAAALEFGGGAGGLLAFYDNVGFDNIVGVDASESQIAVARAKCPQYEMFCADAFDFLADSMQRFAIISAFDVIEHIEKDRVIEFLELIRANLEDEGVMILRLPNASSLFASELRYGDFTHVSAFTPSCLETLCYEVGFSQVECREVSPPLYGYSFAATVRNLMWQFLRIFIKSINIIETGSPGAGVYSRVFLLKAKK